MKTILLSSCLLFTLILEAQNALKSSKEESFDGTNWTNTYGMDYEYDSQGNLITEISYDWISSAFELQNKTEYVYNSDNKVVESISKGWNGTQWINEYKSTFTYNTNGNPITLLSENWVSSGWENEFKSEITYSSNLPNELISYEWDGTQWVNESKLITTFSGTQLITQHYQNWSGTQWENDSRNTHTYNSSDKITSGVQEVWTGSAWEVDITTNYNYDGNWNCTSWIEDASYGKTKNENEIDLSEQLADYDHPFKDKTGLDYLFDIPLYINKIMTESTSDYDASSNTYNLTTKITYNYENSLLNLEDEKPLVYDVKLYPNPANDFIQIIGNYSDENIEIYNILGEKVMGNQYPINGEIDIRTLNKGLYILNIGKHKVIKFIKN
ncbi:MAG: T9SS type A sorting domain-containing protein [Flavobacteriales bacterium]